MSNFEKAFDRVLIVEGGDKFTNHKNDRGRATKWGITQGRYSMFLGRPATPEDVEAMPKSHAHEIYRKDYWGAMNCDLISDFTLAYLIFDQGVNRGVVGGGKILQETLNKHFGHTLIVDGQIGPVTLRAANATDKVFLANKFIQTAQDEYVQIAKANPTQMDFLAGWINRTQKLYDHVFEDVRPVKLRVMS